MLPSILRIDDQRCRRSHLKVEVTGAQPAYCAMPFPKDRRSARAALIEGYLTAERRAAVGTGCPIAGLAVDVAREPHGRPVRAAFREGLEALIEILAGAQPTPEPHDAHERAVVQMATLVGAMVLARATRGNELSDEFLSAARRSLLGRDA